MIQRKKTRPLCGTTPRPSIRNVRLIIVTSLFAVLALSGCSSALTEASAAKAIQGYIDTQQNGIVMTSIIFLTGQLGTQHTERSSVPAIQRLMKQGMVEEITGTAVYPDLSGTYRGTVGGYYRGNITYTVKLHTTPANPPEVEGEYQDCLFGRSCWDGTVSGVVEQRAASTLTLRQISRRPTDTATVRSLVVSLTRGTNGEDMLVGALREGETSNPIELRGRAGAQLERKIYVYKWTDKFPKEALQPPDLQLGHLVVDGCDHLLLATEISATATCQSHIVLTDVAKAIWGEKSTKETLQASFGRQPNGKWIGTKISYSPPSYEINQ